MKCATRQLRSGQRRGFTLIESVLAVVITAVMIVAALGAAGAVARTRLTQRERSAGMALARALMSEIVQKAYVDPAASNPADLGPAAGETRATFNDVDDYENLNESPPRDRSGTVIPGYTGWQRTVQVRFMDQNLAGTVSGSDTGLKRIVVTVKSPAGIVSTLTGLRSSSSGYEKTLMMQRTYVGESIVTLQVGSDAAAKVVSSANPLNQVP